MEGKSYKWDANLYQKSSLFQFNLGLMAIERLKPVDKEKILEIGCGNAMLTIELAKLIPNGEIIAIELSKDMVKQAKTNLAKYGINNVNIENMDAIKLDYKNEFDAVFSNSAIHWIRNLEVMYKSIYDSLKSPGRIIIQSGLKELNLLFQVLFDLVKLPNYRDYFQNFRFPWRFLTIKENYKILKSANFKNINVEPYSYCIEFDSEEDVVNFCKAAPLVPLLNSIPAELTNNFIDDFKKVFLKNNQPNPLEIKMTRVFISANKIT